MVNVILRIFVKLLVPLLLFSLAAIASAKTLSIPLRLENPLIEQILKVQVFKDNNASLRLSDDESGCYFVEISNPKVSTVQSKLKVRVKAKVRIGQSIGGSQCLYLIKWGGYIDLYHDVKIIADGKKISIVVKKSEILTQQLKRDQLLDSVWQGIRRQLYPKLQAMVIDLKEPIDNLKSIIPFAVAQKNVDLIRKSMDSIVIDTINIKNYGVLVGMKVNVPDLVPLDEKPVAKLSDAELVSLENKLNAIDAFTTFTLKQFLKPSLPDDIRADLFTILFDVRYEIVRILSAPEDYGSDPVRVLFLSTWAQLSPVIRQISRQYKDQAIALHVLSFITASDALASIDEFGPDLGLDISVNGLRRLARLLNDNPDIDPIMRDESEDEQLRKLLGLQSVIFDSGDEIAENFLDYFVSTVSAAENIKLPAKLTKKLNNWVPKKHELNRYLPMVKKVLAAVSQAQLDANKQNKSIRTIYRNLVYAAAWQESCWKQFANIKGYRKPVRSYSGDLGLMQINPRVWRGFYNLHKLKWDIVYNANAGAEILMLYMTRYVIKNNEHIKTGKMDNLARATYSGYNGGPSQYKRYRKKNISGKLKKIDTAFYKKYRAVRDKGSMSVKSCYAGI